ncbi:Hypothetical protein, putative, partial [Bodo saltans]
NHEEKPPQDFSSTPQAHHTPWLGCALLCTILDGTVGIPPFVAQHLKHVWWFETSTLSCTLPDGRLMRRQVVSSVARDVAVRMLPLGEVLNERLLITGDALRCVSAASLQGRVQVVLDHLKFDSLVSRRRFIFVFSILSSHEYIWCDWSSCILLSSVACVSEIRCSDDRRRPAHDD